MSASHVTDGTDDDTPRGEAARALARAMAEARYAQRRFLLHTRISGYHGEDFELRWQRVRAIVARHNERAVREARENALRAGWTSDELDSLGLASEA